MKLHATLVLLVGCATTHDATTAAPPPGAAAPAPVRVSRMRIVDARIGAERSSRSEPVMVPFGANQNGNELVYALLGEAARRGASAVGELVLTMTFRWRDALVECRTPVYLAGDPRLAERPDAEAAAGGAGAYGTDIQQYRPQSIEFVAQDRELECATVKVPVTRRRLAAASERGVEVSHVRDLPVDQEQVITTYETHDDCHWVDLTRPAARYDYEVKLGFVPPNWDRLAARFSRRALVPARPRCYTITEDALAGAPAYRLTATAYHRGRIAHGAPRSLPSRAEIDAQLAPVNSNPKHCDEKMTPGDSVKLRPTNPSDDELNEGEPILEQCRRGSQVRNARRGRILPRDEERAVVDGDDEEPPFPDEP